MNFRGLEVISSYGKLDCKAIRDVENVFNIKFPPLYVELMSNYNSATFEKNAFSYYDDYNCEDRLNTMGFDGVSTEDCEVLQDILRQYIYDDPIYGYPNVYSFGGTANGDFVCFDYRDNPNGNEPKVCIVIHDEYDDITGKNLLFPIANSFEEFLDRLFDFNELHPDDFDLTE